MRFEKILVPTDLSPEGDRALRALPALVREARAEIVLLHVVENVGSTAPRPGTEGHLVAGTRQELERAEGELAARRALFAPENEVRCVAIVASSVPEGIAARAEAEGCDLIVLSSHGRSGFRRLILGSVSESLLRIARVPVLVFPRHS